jgi:3-deoxy-D-manno-octulosonic-acid transferase
MLLFFYTAALYLSLLVGAPFWLFRMATTAKYRHGLRERLGRVPPRLFDTTLDARPMPPVIWVHAVSVGEVLAASRMIDELQQAAPAYRVLLSTTTRTGQELARAKYGEGNVFYLPLDFGWAVRRYLHALRPALVVLLETEFWPNFLACCHASGIPVAVVNARISDRSYPRYRRLRILWQRILGAITLALAQTDEDAQRLVAIGVSPDRVRTGGNLKFDVRTASPAAITSLLARHLPAAAPLLVAGSTLEGEESLLLAAWPRVIAACPGARFVLAPRHPERFAAVAALLDRSGLCWMRRSQWILAPGDLPEGAVFLLDSIGELASVYSLASTAFVGGSLVPAGGHNPLEPAQYGVPIVMGPHYGNFRAIVATLRAEQAIEIVDPDQLADTLIAQSIHREQALRMGQRACHVFEREAGATGRAVNALLGLLPKVDS